MALYDQVNGTGTPWYAPQGTAISTTPATVYRQPQTQPILNQFVWVNNPGTVEMWPVAAGSEMTFIDNENMLLYVKRVDEYNHPLKTRKFKLVELSDEEKTKPEEAKSAMDMVELKAFLSEEIDKALNVRLKGLFNQANEGETK